MNRFLMSINGNILDITDYYWPLLPRRLNFLIQSIAFGIEMSLRFTKYSYYLIFLLIFSPQCNLSYWTDWTTSRLVVFHGYSLFHSQYPHQDFSGHHKSHQHVWKDLFSQKITQIGQLRPKIGQFFIPDRMNFLFGM